MGPGLDLPAKIEELHIFDEISRLFTLRQGWYFFGTESIWWKCPPRFRSQYLRLAILKERTFNENFIIKLHKLTVLPFCSQCCAICYKNVQLYKKSTDYHIKEHRPSNISFPLWTGIFIANHRVWLYEHKEIVVGSKSLPCIHYFHLNKKNY